MSLIILLQAAALFPRVAEAHLSIIRQGPESRGVSEAGDSHGWAVTAGDFNGDGYDDLAMGAPNEDVSGFTDAGAVVIDYGTPYGVTHVGAQLFTAETLGQTAHSGDRFGYALASGDFNDDGYDDLAIGAPFYDLDGQSDSGWVYVLRGGPGGPSLAFNLDQEDGGGGDEPGDHFGASFAVGNFNGDSAPYMDLAVGAPGEDSDTGSVFFFLGSSAGLPFGGSDWFLQSYLGYNDNHGDQFGFALAAGNLIGSSHDDLAVGTPYRDPGAMSDAGAVYVIPGSASGLVASGHDLQLAPGGFEAGAWFGSALAAGKFFSGPYLSLAIGEPGRNYLGLSNSGRVVVYKGGATTLDNANPLLVTENNAGGTTEAGDHFGKTLAGARYWDPADGYDDLAVGAPGDGLNFAINAGQVNIFVGGPNGPSGSYGWGGFNQGTLNEPVEAQDQLGFSLAFGRFDATGLGSLATGAPGENSGAGMVHVIAPWRQTYGLSCRHSVAYDCSGNLIFSQKPFDQVSIASTTKTMTVLIAAERSQLPASDPDYVSLDTEYIVPSWCADQVGGSQVPLLTHEKTTLRDLMYTCIFRSGNDAAYAIADLIWGAGGPSVSVPFFVQEMNERAAALGMTGTHFHNPAGLDDEHVGPDLGAHYSTPVDMAKLSRAAIENPLVAEIVGSTEYEMVRHLWGFGSYVDLEWVCENFFTGVLTNMAQPATGIKGGWTPNAQATGLFSASPPWGGAAIAGHYYTTNPPSDDTYGPNAAELLKLGLGGCNFILNYTPDPPDYVVSFPGLSTLLDQLEGGSAEIMGTLDDLAIDISRHAGQGTTSAFFELGRISENTIGRNEEVRYGIAPFQSHDDIRIINMGMTTAILEVTMSTERDPIPLTIRSMESAVLPASEPSEVPPTFVMMVKNLGDEAYLSIEEEYNFDVALSGGPGAPPALTASLTRDGSIINDGFHVMTTGRDPNPGSEITVRARPRDLIIGVEDPSAAPAGGTPPLVLRPAAPNPFRTWTRIGFDMAESGRVDVGIYDAAGRLVRAFDEEALAAGRWGVNWDGSKADGTHVPAGVYFFRVALNGKEAAEGRVVLLR